MQLNAYNNNIACQDSVAITIVVDTAEQDYFNIIIPKVFSPNNDGLNDGFAIFIGSNDTVAGVSCSVFNRWGQAVSATSQTPDFSENGVTIELWDGVSTLTNQPAAVGAYYFVLSYVIKEREFTKKGNISLVRKD